MPKRKSITSSASMLVACFLFVHPAAAGAGDSTSGTAATKRVLVLQSYHKGLTWSDGEEQGIRDELDPREDVEVHTEYLDAKRFPYDAISGLAADFLSRKYADYAFDVVIVCDNSALAFMAANHQTIFPGTSVVFCGINNFVPEMLLPFDGLATGVVQALDPGGTIELIHQLQPDLGTLAVVSGTTPTAAAIRDVVAQELAQHDPKQKVVWLDALDTPTLQARLADLKPHDAVLLCNFNRDAAGVYYAHETGARMVCDHSAAPVYAMEDLYIGTGIVGGDMVSAHEQGATAARLCLQVLDTGDLPDVITTCPDEAIFDFPMVAAHGLDLTRLTTDATVVNRPVTLYQQHKLLIWNAIVAFCLLILAVIGLTFGLLRGKAAARTLRRNEENLRTTLDSIGDAVIATDTTGSVTRMNPVAQRLTGWTLEDAHGKPLSQCFKIVNALTGLDAVNPVARVLEDGKVVGLANYTKLISRDGTEYQIADSAAPILTDEGGLGGVVLVFRDVTDEYRMQEELQHALSELTESERRLREVQQMACLGHWSWNVKTGEVDWSEDMYRIFHRDPAEFKPHIDAILELSPWPEERQRDQELINKTIESHEQGAYEQRFLRPDGSNGYYYSTFQGVYDDDGELVSIMGTAQDTTERRQAEEAFRESHRVLETLVANLPGFVYRCKNDASWTMEYLRGQVQECTGYAPEDFIANRTVSFNDVITEEHRERLWTLWQKQLSIKAPMQAEYTIRTRDGHIKWVWEQGRGVFDDQGELLALEGFICDITDRKEAEAERETLEAQLRQSQKMEAVGQLAGGVAHDFNNLLTAILGNVELSMTNLRTRVGEDDNIVQSMEEIEKAAQRASVLTRQLLTFSRRDIIQPQSLNLSHILTDLQSMLQRLITENIKLELITDPQLAAVHADAGQIEQVIVNLVVNAVHAMPDGGHLVLEVQNIALDSDYTRDHTEVVAGPYVQLAVSDTGVGMVPAVLEQIFEPFFTTKPLDKGSGLGLATVHGIIKRAGGHVRVYSEPKEGTTFKVYLPAHEHSAAAKPPADQPESEPPATGTLLLCEDDQPVRELVALSLRSAGYHVLAAGRGAECIAAAANHDGPIDLLITDVIMPDMNGRALSDRLRASRPTLPVLFISGYTSNVIAHHGVLDQGVEFLEKPFSRAQLLAKVRAVRAKAHVRA